jgi:hypothetical protein
LEIIRGPLCWCYFYHPARGSCRGSCGRKKKNNPATKGNRKE